VSLAGWGHLFNETDGQYAGAAKVMAQGGDWVVPENNGVPRLVKPPLLTWMAAGAMGIFGVGEFAARLPGALALAGWVWVTFLLGSRMGGRSRGILAGGILATLLGTFTLGRIVMPEPVFSALVAASIYCFLRAADGGVLAGRWVVAMWVCGALAAFVKGPHGLLYPVVIVLGALCARRLVDPSGGRGWDMPPLRVFSLAGLAVALVINLPWYAAIEARYPGFLGNLVFVEFFGHVTGSSAPATDYTAVPRWQFLLLHLAWWFPWSVACLVALPGVPRRVRGPRGWSLDGWVVVVWGAVVLGSVLVAGQRQDYYAMAMWPCFALGAAKILEGVRPVLPARVVAVVLAAAGLALVAASHLTRRATGSLADRATALSTVAAFGPDVWASLALIAVLSIGGAVVLCLLTRRTWLPMGLAGACLGVGAVAGTARVAPYFSLAPIAGAIEKQAGPGGKIIFDGDIDTASSLLFYTNARIGLLRGDPGFFARPSGEGNHLTREELRVLWGGAAPVALIVEEADLKGWQRWLGGPLEPLARCGTLVLLGNSREKDGRNIEH
jgi:4-amino-4-deoxy-L-arabinose transferase-like glycosyltransferase